MMTAAGVPLRATVLDGLGEAADNRRDGHQDCEDCRDCGGACPDRRADLAEADAFEAAAAIIRRVTSDHWLIAVLRGDTTATRGNIA